MVEMATILQRHASQYRALFGDRMPPSHHKVMRAIERCRTPVLGGHVYHCPACNRTQYRYHSCRNRHCPKCQNDKALRWLEQQRDLLLPVPYFLVTFTLPRQLRSLARSHQKTIYSLLFRSSAGAMRQLALDDRFVGGQMGFIGVLHTWGRTLSYHPHLHYLVPGGGLDADDHWRPSRKNFLLPVKALSVIFRAKFRDALRKAAPELFAGVAPEAWEQDWVVHSQPVGDGLAAVRYLAPYIFRVAISNQRIVRLADDKVAFRYRASDTGRLKRCTLAAQEFIRRFLQHILPKGFVKVRYYGFFSHGSRQSLAALRQCLNACLSVDPSGPVVDLAPSESPRPQGSVRCPTCNGPMQRRGRIPPLPRSPPAPAPA
jgi:hypothetical protein